jgi:hypothetical protein
MTMLSVLAINKGSQGYDDTVVTRRGIVIEIEERFAGAMGDVVLEGLEEVESRSFTAGAAAILAFI